MYTKCYIFCVHRLYSAYVRTARTNFSDIFDIRCHTCNSGCLQHSAFAFLWVHLVFAFHRVALEECESTRLACGRCAECLDQGWPG
uniref:Uncharacterized protein n=1 Tax=Ixodes ricinus TaxID=34613 RepID=A0A6B0U8N5_IXORI